MSGNRGGDENRGGVPARWLHCPRKAMKLIQNKFLAFKTPLSAAYDSQVPEECRFTVDMLFTYLKSYKLKLGLWIDLTNTSRFYDRKCIENYGCKYLKLQCRGHGETPSEDQTRTFVQVCKNFIAHNPLEIIGVHCTHGFNRTGFLIISYMVEVDGTSVDAALAEFAIARPPGIYKGDYIQELYRKFDEMEDAPPPPARPTWCLEYDDSNVEDTDNGTGTVVENSDEAPSKRKGKREFNNKNPVFMAGVPGVTPIVDKMIYSGVQKRVQEICGWKSGGFPGCQPVTMDLDNIMFLHNKPYRVSWKADGTRYMMLIQGDREVYFVDRDNSVFQVTGLTFPHVRDITRCLRDTLLDGEMVIDKDGNKNIPRYLVYDVVMYDGQDVSKLPFHPDRYGTIEKQIIAGRLRAMKEGRLLKEREPFSVRLKYFWDVTQSKNLLGEKFASQLSHEPDGLIFQPAKEKYCTGPAPELLKWKPVSLNSVDFRLKIVTETGEGILPRKVGHLYVGGQKMPYGMIKMSKQIKDLDNAIVECKLENGQWVFMRQRVDKSFPNSHNTAESVCKSIFKPVTKEVLLDFIEKRRFAREDVCVRPDSELMRPPAKRPRYRSVMLWCVKDLASKDRRSLRVNIEYDHATLIRWSPDGKAFIIHKAMANAIEVYKVAKKSDGFLASATKALEFPKRHTEDVVGMDIACTGKYIITCSKVNDLIVWDLKGQPLATVELHLGSTHRARISPCGRFIVASGFTPDVNVFEVVFKQGEFKQVAKAFDLAGHTSGVHDFGFSADTSQMATVSKDGTYRFYDTKIEFEKGEDPHLLTTGTWDTTTPTSLVLSPNGEVLVIAHGSSISFYSTITGVLDNTIEDLFIGPITCLAFEAAGEYLLVSGDKHIKIFRNVTGYRTAIESAKRKLELRQTQATRERLQKIIHDNTEFLTKMGEKRP
ncbi:PREDICTED: mRNA-capping enzyme [Dinoponera quadriceps]|uniref:mRNA guanylyltransferase n=1 Tax=Dinoponera quadriceps TaxID=609295 RepID=A0A6P3XMD0_DINQU|nr:PREDICTED: mRNA-capping enzyme [Dinoponera quadriceps]